MASNTSRNQNHRTRGAQDKSQSDSTSQATLDCAAAGDSDSIAEQIDLIQTQLADIAASAADSFRSPADPHNQIGELREELLEQGVLLETLSQQLRSDFQTALDDLRQAQADTMKSQAEVLRSLTGTLIAADEGQSSAVPEQQWHQLEERLAATVRAALAKAPAAALSPEPGGKMPASTGNRADDSSQSWEQIRSSFLQGAGSQNGLPERDHNTDEIVSAFMESDAGVAIAVAGADNATSQAPENLTDTQPLPRPGFALDCEVADLGDVESMSESELRAALLDRDHLVATLIGRVRHLQDAYPNAITPEELQSLREELPEALQERVTETLDRMNEQLRLSELEMSLERARLARQKAQVEQSQHSLDRQARQMGLERRDDGTYIVDRTEPSRKQPRRWLGRLGIGE